MPVKVYSELILVTLARNNLGHRASILIRGWSVHENDKESVCGNAAQAGICG